MNKSKRGLSIAAGVLTLLIMVPILIVAFIYLAGSAYLADLFESFGISGFNAIGPGVIGGVLLALAIIQLLGAIFLFVSTGSKYNKGLFITGAIFVILSTFVVSIPAILMYVALASKDEPQQEQPKQEVQP